MRGTVGRHGIGSRPLLTAVTLCLGTPLALIAVLEIPRIALSGAAFGSLIAVLGLLRLHDPHRGGSAAKARIARRASVPVAAGVAFGWLVVTGLSLIVGPVLSILLVGLLAMITFDEFRSRHPKRRITSAEGP